MLDTTPHSLKFRPSRLDLIDNNQLTSFPLAHPNVAEIGPAGELLLVEDYIHYPKGFRKKTSVFDLRRAIEHDITPPSAILPLLARNQSINSDSTLQSETELYLKQTQSNLRYCVVCERPLYNLSSLDSLTRCAELVCCNCFEEYETLEKAIKKLEPDISLVSLESVSDSSPETITVDFTDPDQTVRSAHDTTATIRIHRDHEVPESATFDAIIATLKHLQTVDNAARNRPRKRLQAISLNNLNMASLFRPK
ncbi:hypothetical protein OGAPHI_005820 [Ogataea philodendri]|uniref:Uncharacterized protein n=1 Tax=Ogataea philodendri TaxID=1378263 RepID=A0A9P8T1A1_9ASCO|nr:uncharacterized protein OGAPHI_005820 [Ogataea philodendri]KAH3662568.1 hypothetical protein OGAPHI_005820 [Ogataea philodendri]